MTNAKLYTRTKELNGITYTAQFNGISAHLKLLDTCKNEYGTLSILELSEAILRNVIVDPANLTPDSFEDMDQMNAVVMFGRTVSEGRFRQVEEEVTNTKKA